MIALITATGGVVPVTLLDLTLQGGIAASEVRLGLVLTLLAGALAVAIARFRPRNRSQ